MSYFVRSARKQDQAASRCSWRRGAFDRDCRLTNLFRELPNLRFPMAIDFVCPIHQTNHRLDKPMAPEEAPRHAPKALTYIDTLLKYQTPYVIDTVTF
jgi:hypothetical protein